MVPRSLPATVCVASFLALVPGAAAKTYTPSTFKDHAPNGCSAKDCTLREAVIAANHHPGRDSVVLSAKRPYLLSVSPTGSDGATSGDLNVTDPISIRHDGRGQAVIDAQQIDRVLFQDTATKPERYTKLSRLVIRGGKTLGTGGGVQLGFGLLGLDHSTVTGNQAGNDGGGIFASSGELTLTDSSVTGNLSGGRGGGVFAATDTTIEGSTLSANQSFNTSSFEGGGGLSFEGSQLKMVNDTVAQNKATAEGGGIDSSGPSTLNDVTITANASDSDNTGGGPAGGVFASGSAFSIANSIIEGNSVGSSASAPDCRGTFTSGGHNLVNDTIGCDGFDAPGDFMSPDPMLGPLHANGGPTKTVALEPGSPAIGNGDTHSSAGGDQRGFKRDSHPDIGAYERGAKP